MGISPTYLCFQACWIANRALLTDTVQNFRVFIFGKGNGILHGIILILGYGLGDFDSFKYSNIVAAKENQLFRSYFRSA